MNFFIVLSFAIGVGLAIICLCGIVGIIQKGPNDPPYNVILPMGMIAMWVIAAIGLVELFKHAVK